MPTYDYKCSNCGHTVEVVHSVHGHGPTACPICGGPMQKAFAPPTVHYRGSGWARKDRSSRPPVRAPATDSSPTSTGSSSVSSTESPGPGSTGSSNSTESD